MTEKRSDYQKRQRKSRSSIFDKIKTAFNDNQNDELDDNPDFKKQNSDKEPLRRSLEGNGEPDLSDLNSNEINQKSEADEKGLRLKKRLNRTILILIVLIILVLLALFHL